MIDLINDCEVVTLSHDNLIVGFDCGDKDLNDFFNHDAILFQQQLLGQTHFFRHKSTKKIVACFSLSADSVKTYLLPNARRSKVKALIPHEKSLQSYPAFLIGRLGVSSEYAGQRVGSQLMDYVKSYCLDTYPYLGRFLVVDAYNNPAVLTFYEKNDFKLVFSSEQQEKENLHKPVDDSTPLYTRQMFYDMMRWGYTG